VLINSDARIALNTILRFVLMHLILGISIVSVFVLKSYVSKAGSVPFSWQKKRYLFMCLSPHCVDCNNEGIKCRRKQLVYIIRLETCFDPIWSASGQKHKIIFLLILYYCPEDDHTESKHVAKYII
jgi:hypothetical protein